MSSWRTTTPALFLVLLVLLRGLSPAALASETTTETARLMSVRYEASIDPTLVHSHETKMRWSSVRHADSLSFYDPTNPASMLAEEADDDLRPTLCRTLARRLGNELFGSLAERLDGAEGRRVMAWKGEAAAGVVAGRGRSRKGRVEGAGGGDGVGGVMAAAPVDMRDLEPTCRFADGKARRFGVKPNSQNESDATESAASASAVVVPEETREIEQTCSVMFTSLLPYYGIGFDLRLTFHERPMSDLTPDQISRMITPDSRGWTQPVRTADVTIEAKVQSPDYGSNAAAANMGLGNAPDHVREEAMRMRARVGNAERAVDRLVARADAVLGVPPYYAQLYGGNSGGDGDEDEDELAPRRMEKRNLGSAEVQLRLMPDHPSTAAAEEGEKAAAAVSGECDDKVPAEVRRLCGEHGMNDEQCCRAWEIMKEDMEAEEEEMALTVSSSDEGNGHADDDGHGPVDRTADEAGTQPPQKPRYRKIPLPTDEELESEMDAWMAQERERERKEAKEQRRAKQRREAEQRERDAEEVRKRREERAGEDVDDVLRRIEEAETRAEEARRKRGEAEESKAARAPAEGATEVEEDITGPPMPSPSLHETAAAPTTDSSHEEL